MTEAAIAVQELRKSFGTLRAVDGISFEVQPGEIFSLLGPNGAGKTTTLAMLSCLVQPDAGDAAVLGHSIRREPMAVKTALGVVPQDIALYEDLTARENLVFWGKMYGLRGAALARRVDAVLEVIGLADRQRERIAKYSGGMKRRVNIGVALLHQPKVLYMDEPTVGIDPQSRRNILDSILSLKTLGMTILYTTHYMEEAAELSDHIGIMDHGQMIACGTHADLVRLIGERDRLRLGIHGDPVEVLDAWKAIPGLDQVTIEDGMVSMLADDSNRALPRLIECAVAARVRITSVEIQEPNLEAVFLHFTGRALRD